MNVRDQLFSWVTDNAIGMCRFDILNMKTDYVTILFDENKGLVLLNNDTDSMYNLDINLDMYLRNNAMPVSVSDRLLTTLNAKYKSNGLKLNLRELDLSNKFNKWLNDLTLNSVVSLNLEKELSYDVLNSQTLSKPSKTEIEKEISKLVNITNIENIHKLYHNLKEHSTTQEEFQIVREDVLLSLIAELYGTRIDMHITKSTISELRYEVTKALLEYTL